MIGTNPFDWSAAAFLALYAALLVGAFIAAMAIAAGLRPKGRPLPLNDEDEMAMLAGGEVRLGETVLARLLARGAATVEKNRVHVAPGAAAGSATLPEHEIAVLPSPLKWRSIRRKLASSAARIEQQLIARGLMMERGEARRLGLLATFPLLAVLAFGAVRFRTGIATESSIAFVVLALLLIATAIAALVRLFGTHRRTKAGTALLKEARQRHARLRRAPTTAETATAVALFGTGVLVGSPWVGLHTMRQRASGGAGGGGGCGGGCGGC